jgi:hypothetical protein
MKISIVASVLILAVGASLGWHDRQQLAVLRTTQKQLAANAAELGISPDAAYFPARSTKRERPTRPAAKKLSTAELIGLARNHHELPLFDSLSALDPADIQALLAETTTNPDLDEQTRMILASCCTTVLANDHPQAALEIFTSSPELFTQGDRGRSLVLTALAYLAKSNLPAALEWLRNHPQHYPKDAKGEIISAVAEQDARLAFRLVTDLDFKISDYAVGQILNSRKTLEEKSTALVGLREYLVTIPDEKTRDSLAKTSIAVLAGHIGRESFDSATRWISGENLTPQESIQFIAGLNISTSNGETGRWIEWLRKSPPDQMPDLKIREIIYQWTASDYQAAMQWAMTQPPGTDRDQVFKTIHGNWPKDDPAGKETFAKEHAIK